MTTKERQMIYETIDEWPNAGAPSCPVARVKRRTVLLAAERLCSCRPRRGEGHISPCVAAPLPKRHGGLRETVEGWMVEPNGILTRVRWPNIEVSWHDILAIGYGSESLLNAGEHDVVLREFFYSPVREEVGRVKLSLSHADDADDVAPDVAFGGVR